MGSIPVTAQAMTTEWLTDAIRTGGRPDWPTITAMTLERIGEGMGLLTEIYRLTLTYAPGATGPKSLIAKFPTTHSDMRALSIGYNFYEREVVFYRDIAATIRTRTPICYLATIDLASQNFILLLEDLFFATSGDQIAGLALPQVSLAVDQVAALHSRWWNAPELTALEGPVPPHDAAPWDTVSERHAVAWGLVAPWIKTRVGPEMYRVGERMCSELTGLFRQNSVGPRTLCHGDFRADNLMFHRDGASDSLIVLDWQIMFQGRGAFDIGYLMSASVTPEVRRAHEMDLLRRYHGLLLADGVEGYGFEDCLHDYRRALLMGFTYAVQAAMADVTHARTAALITAMATRCEAAYLDLGLAEFLP